MQNQENKNLQPPAISAIFTEAHAQRDPIPMLNNGVEVLTAICNVKSELLELGGVSKRRRTESNNNKFAYNYRSMGDIYQVITPLMNKHHLICFPHTESATCAKYINGKGDIIFKALVTIRFTFVSSKDASSFEVSIIGEANDSGDKAVAKATTNAEKLLYEKTFNITSDIENGTIQNPPAQNQWKNQNQWQNQNQQQNRMNRPAQRQQQNLNNPPAQQNQQGNKQQQDFLKNSDELASLNAKNSLDERLRKFNVTLIQAIKHHGFEFHTLTRSQLLIIQKDASTRFKQQ